MERAAHTVRPFVESPRRSRQGEFRAQRIGLCFWASPIPPTQQRPVLLLPALSLLTVAHILTWLASDPGSLWPQLPCASHKGAGREETLAWPGCPPFPPSPPSLQLLGEGKVKMDLSTSPILLPLAFLPLPLGAGRSQRKQSFSSSLTLSLPHFLLQEDSLLPPHPGSGPGLGVKFLRASRKQRPAWAGWTPHLSHFTSSVFSLPQPRVLCTSLPIVKSSSVASGKVLWKAGFLGVWGYVA